MSTVNIKTIEGFNIPGDWEKQSKMLKDKYHQLKDVDLSIEHQEEGVMLMILANTLCKTPTQIKNIIQRIQTDMSYFRD